MYVSTSGFMYVCMYVCIDIGQYNAVYVCMYNRYHFVYKYISCTTLYICIYPCVLAVCMYVLVCTCVCLCVYVFDLSLYVCDFVYGSIGVSVLVYRCLKIIGK